MGVISNLSIEEFQNMIERFDQRYVNDWASWISIRHNHGNVASEFGRVLRRWQACRPNRMRRTQNEAMHNPPYLEQLIEKAYDYIEDLNNFDISINSVHDNNTCHALTNLWKIFRNLSYHGRARNGLAGTVGISKSVLLLTEGRVGPAFDFQVRNRLNIHQPQNVDEWISALDLVSIDIQSFQKNNNCTIYEAAPKQFRKLNAGRIYDMALGPRK